MLAIARDVGANVGGEQVQHFAGFGVAACFGLGVDGRVVNDHIKNPVGPGHKDKVVDGVLVVSQKVSSHAHGAR